MRFLPRRWNAALPSTDLTSGRCTSRWPGSARRSSPCWRRQCRRADAHAHAGRSLRRRLSAPAAPLVTVGAPTVPPLAPAGPPVSAARARVGSRTSAIVPKSWAFISSLRVPQGALVSRQSRTRDPRPPRTKVPLLHLTRPFVDRLQASRGADDSCSDVILRLAKAISQGESPR